MAFGRREVKEEFVFHGRPVVGWSSELLRGMLMRALDRMLVAKNDPLLRRGSAPVEGLVHAGPADIGAKLLGLGLTGSRAGAVLSQSSDEKLSRDLELAVRLHVPLTLIRSLGLPEEWSRANVGSLLSSGAFCLFAGNAQEVLDFALLAIRISERSLIPGVVAEDVTRSTFDVSCVLSNEDELVDVFLGESDETIEASTAAQEMTLGSRRRRVPETLSPDRPVGVNPRYPLEQRRLLEPGHEAFYASHTPAAIEEALDDFGALTGRFYAPLDRYRTEDADYVLVALGSSGEAVKSVVDLTRQSSRIRLGAVRPRVIHPFPSALGEVVRGKRGVTVLSRGARSDGFLSDAIASVLGTDSPPVFTFNYTGSAAPSTDEWLAAVGNMTADSSRRKSYFVVPEKDEGRTRVPALERLDQLLDRYYADSPWLHSVDSGASDHGRSHAVRLYADRQEVMAEGAGLVAQAVAAAGGMMVEGRLGDGPPAAYVLDFAADGRYTGILGNDFLNEDAVLNGLGQGSTVVLVSSHDKRHFWPAQPEAFRRTANDRELAVYVTSSYEAEDGASDPALEDQLRVNTLLGALLRAVFDGRLSIEDIAGRLDEKLTREGYPGRIRAPFLDALKHGFQAVERISLSDVPAAKAPMEQETPWALEGRPDRDDTQFDPARFWSSIGFGLAAGRTNLLSPDPYLSSRTIPAMTSVLGARRSEPAPQWLPENCTGCGLCWTYCPHTALPVTVAGIEDFIELGRAEAEARGIPVTQVQRLGKHLAKRVHKLIAEDELKRYTALGAACDEALDRLLDAAGLDEETAQEARDEFASVFDEIRTVPVARTEAFFQLRESTSRGSGKVLSINLDPDVCTACGICAAVCPEDAIDRVPVSPRPSDELRKTRAIASAVVSDGTAVSATSTDFPERELAHRLVDSEAYYAATGTGRADPGSGTKMAVHLVAATLASEAKPKAERLGARLAELEELLKKRLQNTLSKSLEVNDFDEFALRLRALGSRPDGIEVSQLLAGSSENVDTERLQALSEAMLDLETLRDELKGSRETTSSVVAVIGNSPTLLEDVQFAMNPFGFPWISAGESDPFALAEGVYEGMLSRALEVVRRLRRASRLVEEGSNVDGDEPVSRETLTEEEQSLVPTVCVFVEALDRSGLGGAAGDLPIRIFWLDRLSEASGLSLSFPAVTDPAWCLAQTTPAHPEHFLRALREASAADGPALVRIHTPEPEKDGFPTDRTIERMQRAVSCRVFPLFLYRPDRSLEWTERWSLDGNPNTEEDWNTEGGRPLTPADWFAGEGRFARLFEILPRGSWDETQVGLETYLSEDPAQREALTAFVEVRDSEGKPRRLGLGDQTVAACVERLNTWRLLQEMAGVRSSLLAVARRQVEDELRESFEAEKERLKTESDAKISEIRAGYEATFRDKLTTRLLSLSGFDGSSTTLASWLGEMEQQGRKNPEPASETEDGA